MASVRDFIDGLEDLGETVGESGEIGPVDDGSRLGRPRRRFRPGWVAGSLIFHEIPRLESHHRSTESTKSTDWKNMGLA